METGDTSNQAGGASKATQGEAMAEEKQSERPTEGSARKRRRATKKKAASSAPTNPAPAKLEALPTEQAVPSPPPKKTSQYVVTIDNQTGVPVKIEKLDDATGKRKELTTEEYGQAMLYAGLSQTPYYGSAGALAAAPAAGVDALAQAYYQGIADYINALTSNR